MSGLDIVRYRKVNKTAEVEIAGSVACVSNLTAPASCSFETVTPTATSAAGQPQAHATSQVQFRPRHDEMLGQCFVFTPLRLPSLHRCSSGARQNRNLQPQIPFVFCSVCIKSWRGYTTVVTAVRVSGSDVLPFPNIHSYPCVSWRVLVSSVVIYNAKRNDVTSPSNCICET
jgi:hypothetical protein